MKRLWSFCLVFLACLCLGGFSAILQAGGQTGSRSMSPSIPPEARRVLAEVRRTGQPLPGHVGGRRFGNYEKRLPQRDEQGRRVEYREWDIHPKLPGRSRGVERLVTGSDRRAWYTADHYNTFTEIK